MDIFGGARVVETWGLAFLSQLLLQTRGLFS